MKKIRKIMVAYDFSDYSKEALKFGVYLADRLKCSLMIVNVVNQRDLDTIQNEVTEMIWSHKKSAEFSIEKFVSDKKKDRLERIEKVVEEVSAGHLDVEINIRAGVPFLELIQAAEDGGADLVIIGRKGRGDLVGVIFGTTAEKMSRHCKISLLSIGEDIA